MQNNAKIRQAVGVLQERGVINSKTARDLLETKIKTQHFYTLPKIHKSTSNPPCRPIVSSVRAPTERISAFVDLLLKPLVKNLPSYVRDTKDFLTALHSLPPLPDHALLFTMDVVGLYNNIPHVDGLEACRPFLNGRRVQDPPTEDIVKLAELVLTLNAFQFEDKYFLQIKGTAMGTRMAPSYANLFMGKLENKILEQAQDSKCPSFYRRFIDDVFGIWFYGEDSLYSSSSSMRTTTTRTSDSRKHLKSLSRTLMRPSRSEASTSPRTCSLNQQTRTSTYCPPATTPSRPQEPSIRLSTTHSLYRQ